jgi:hypothetical protein
LRAGKFWSGKKIRDSDTPTPGVFVRVANKGLILDATSRLADLVLKVVVFSAGCEFVAGLTCVFLNTEIAEDSEKRRGKGE